MVGLVGVTGHAGAGKTTAAKHLSTLTDGRYLYLGQAVLDEVCARGLPDTPENERQVRIDLRREKGPAALAIPYVDLVAECLGKGIPVFVDAIFNEEELDVFASCPPSGSARSLAIDASLDIRSARLARRPDRPFNSDELQKRDKTERERLRTDAVITSAEHRILNEGTFEEFYRRLAEFVGSCA